MRIAVLSPGFTTPNGRAFLLPLVVWKKPLARGGFNVEIVGATEHCKGYDAILVDSKFHRQDWLHAKDTIYADFSFLRRENGKLIYCDTTDSTGWIQSEILPLVDRYWKFQLLRDREAYLNPMYAHRVYADYYHRRFGVKDDEPEWSFPVPTLEGLGKLDVAWNSGLADYSWLGPYRMAAYAWFPFKALLGFAEWDFASPSSSRPNDVSCRFGARYPRKSVAWQRAEIIRRFGEHMPTDKLSRRSYLAELRRSKLVMSPFGYGEITLKDFEVFRAGSLLIKPDMSHLDTWPDLFVAGETMVAHSWNLDDFEAVIEGALASPGESRAIAEAGQERYRRHITAATGPALFCEHFDSLLARA